MKANESLIAWTPMSFKGHPTAGQVKVGRAMNTRDPEWAKPYRMRKRHALQDSAKMLFVHFHTLVVRDGIPPQVAHEAFLVVDEYAQTISPDIHGARE